MGMKVVAINCTVLGGGGKVMLDIANLARKSGYIYYTFSPESKALPPTNHFYFLSRWEHNINAKIGIMTGYGNALLSRGTLHLIKEINRIKPDVIHLHGLQGWYLNYNLFTDYLKKKKIPTVWTQHDCWSFTGKCPYYTIVDCDKWKTGCFDCPQLSEYPKSKNFDNSRFMYNYKRKRFLNIPNLTLVPVSNWLQNELKQSFLKEYRSVVIENGVDTDLFKYKESALREEYCLKNKFIILGVASGWSKRKGFDDFICLSEMIKNKKMSGFKIVLVGVTDEQRLICEQHDILSFKRTQNVDELIEWYSVADVFFNPSMEESFGLVTIEAMSCGTPVVVYNSTASPELVEGTDCYCLQPHDIDGAISSIMDIKKNGQKFYQEKCIQKVKTDYNMDLQYKKYLNLYNNIYETR